MIIATKSIFFRRHLSAIYLKNYDYVLPKTKPKIDHSSKPLSKTKRYRFDRTVTEFETLSQIK